MRMMKVLSAVLLLGISVLPIVALAQTPVPKSTPAPTPDKIRKAVAATNFLQKKLGISSQEARRRLELEDEISSLSAHLADTFPTEFGGMHIEHTPAYKVVLGFTRAIAVADLGKTVSPALQQSLSIELSTVSVAKIQTSLNEISSAVLGRGLEASVRHDPKRRSFVVTVGESVVEATVRALLVKDFGLPVIIEKGLPTRELQNTAQPGDFLDSGHAAYNDAYKFMCTMGFAVRASDGKPAILTGSTNHCSTSVTRFSTTGHWVDLPATFHSRYLAESGKSYDFRAHYLGTVATEPYVFAKNDTGESYKKRNSSGQLVDASWANVQSDFAVPDEYVPIEGSVTNNVSSTSSNAGHPVGQARCKSGFRTGTTCGFITAQSINGDTDKGPYYAYVRVSDSSEMVIAYGGDSGGPVYTYPSYSTFSVKAAGLLTNGNTGGYNGSYDVPCITYEQSCHFNYMPIDRINDRVPMSLITTAGNVTP